MKDPLRQFLTGILLLAVATMLAFAPDAWVPMMARSFMLQWSCILAMVALVTMWRKAWTITACALGGMLLLSAQVRQPPMASSDPSGKPQLRLLHMNVLQTNTRHAEILAVALASDADIISVQEVDHRWAEWLSEGLSDAYPYHVIEPRTNCYGIALFSRIPLEYARVIVSQGAPFIEASLTVDDRRVRLFAVHTTSPGSYGHFLRRNAQLVELAGMIQEQDAPAMVIGDLNTVPWDRAFSRFCRSTATRTATTTNSRTWPVFGPLALIPLDHLLVSEAFMITSMNTVELPGSDHRGLLADVALRTDTRPAGSMATLGIKGGRANAHKAAH